MFSHCGKVSARLAANFRLPKGGRLGEQVRGLRQEAPQSVEQHRRLPEEHARVPIEVSRGKKLLRGRCVGLFAEAHDANRVRSPATDALREIRCSRSRSRPSAAGCRAPRYCLPPADLKAGLSRRTYSRGLPITWSAGNTPITAFGIDRLENMRGQPDGGSGVALRRLGQDLALGNFGKLAYDLGAQMSGW